MTEPVWIPRETVEAIHAGLVERFGGLAGLRDEALLDSSLHRPLQLSTYGKPDMFDLAAAYAGGIVRNHPFFDGNKRTGFMIAYVFLESNGLSFGASEESVVSHTRALAAGELDERAYAAWLAESCRGPETAP